MKLKLLKGLLALIATATLVAGCATSNQGAQGDDTQIGGGAGSSSNPYANGNGGANGRVTRTNPFGVGAGTGNTQ